MGNFHLSPGQAVFLLMLVFERGNLPAEGVFFCTCLIIHEELQKQVVYFGSELMTKLGKRIRQASQAYI